MLNNVSHIKPKKSGLLDYFTQLYNSGTFSSSKSALFHIVFSPQYSSNLEHKQIEKYFKGAYNLGPPTQKPTFVWNVKDLLDYFIHRGGNGQLSDKSLTQKLLVLLLLLVKECRMTVKDIGIRFSHNYVFKHSKPVKKLDSLYYRAYHNKKLCVVDCLKDYLKRRNTKV